MKIHIHDAFNKTASVSSYFEEALLGFSSVLCQHVSLWFCDFDHAPVSAAPLQADLATGISTTDHHGEIEHHFLDPARYTLQQFVQMVHGPGVPDARINITTSLYIHTLEFTAEKDEVLPKYLPMIVQTLWSYFYMCLFSHNFDFPGGTFRASSHYQKIINVAGRCIRAFLNRDFVVLSIEVLQRLHQRLSLQRCPSPLTFSGK